MLKSQYKICGIIITVFLLPLISFAQTKTVPCSKNGFTIEAINGIFTKEGSLDGLDGASGNLSELKHQMAITSYNGEPLNFKYLYNPTHGLFGVIDLTDTAIQKTFEGVDMKDPDFLKMLNSASAQVKTQKVLLVAHSQGNFYANNFYKAVTASGDISEKSIGVYSVATPANYVAGNGRYRTSDTDTVINLARNVLPGTFLPAHDSIDYLDSDDSGKGHDFREVYLKYRGEEIKREIEESLGELSTDSARSEDTLCINPPVALSVVGKITNSVIYPIDLALATGAVAITTTKSVAVGAYHVAVNTAVWTYHAGVTAAKWTYHTGKKAVAWTYHAGTSAVKTVGHAVGSVASTAFKAVTGIFSDKSLAGNNSASVILVTQGAPKPTTLSLAQEKVSVTTPAIKTPVANLLVATPTNTPVASNTVAKPLTIVSLPKLALARTTEYGSGGGGGGGGAPAPLAPQIAEEVKDDTIATSTASAESVVDDTEETTASTTPVLDLPPLPTDGVTPLSPSDTTLASTTVIFSGTYTNNSSFDTIVFELKNISTSTATSTVSHTIATTTGTDLTYNKEITLGEVGDWQYHARLEDTSSASSTPWSPLAFFNIAISTSTAENTTATSTETTATTTSETTLGYTIVAEQSDHSTLDTTPNYMQGFGIQRNVVLSQPVTFSGANKGDKGRVVIWYKFGYEQDCSNLVSSLMVSNSFGAALLPVSAIPSWDGSCIFRLEGSADDSITLPAGTYALYSGSHAGYFPPYVYGKAGATSSAVYCAGTDIYGNHCGEFKGYSSNLSDFAYIITSDTYTPPTKPDGVNSIPDTLSPIIAKQTDHSAPNTTILDGNSGYSAIQWNVELPQSVIFSGANKGDKGRVVTWYSFAPGQDCSTIGSVFLTAGYNSGISLSPISKTPGLDGSCVFHLDSADESVTVPPRVYALGVGGYSDNGSAPIPLGKSGGNSNAVYCAGGEIKANFCDRQRAYATNISDFAYIITQDNYGIPTPAPTPSPAPETDTVSPVITSCTFNGVASDIIADFATTTPTVTLVLTASENVNWMSVTIEDQNNHDNYKRFGDGDGCEDSTAVCTKIWDGTLSNPKGAPAPDGDYRIKVHIEDLSPAKNSFEGYLSPYFIAVKTATSTPQ